MESATNNTHYTVLSMNIAGYEIIHPIKEKSNRAKYIMVTDDPELADPTNSWEIVVDDKLSGSAFEKVLQVRYNPWRYTDDYVVIEVDGSVGIDKSLDALVDKYLEGGYDMSIMLHPTRNIIYDEYLAWVTTRQYPAECANNVLSWMQVAEGYPVKEYKGLAQLCYRILTHNRLNEDLNRLVYSWCRYLGDKATGIERVDQCVFSMILQKYFNNAKIMFVDQRMYQSQFFTWYPHHSEVPFQPMDVKDMTEPYFFNKRIHNQIRPQDL